MTRLIYAVVFIAIIFPSTTLASSQQDVISKFKKLDASFEVGTTAIDVQRQLIDIKFLINEIKETNPTSKFVSAAEDLFQDVEVCLNLARLFPYDQRINGAKCAGDSIQNKMPTLKDVSNTSSKETNDVQKKTQPRANNEKSYTEDNMITLSGKLVSSIADGSETIDGKPKRFLAIQLDKAITFLCQDSTDDSCAKEENIKLIQLSPSNKYLPEYENQNGRHVKVDGTLFHRATGHHFTPVLMTVRKIY